MAAALTGKEIEQLRLRFRDWLRWLMAMHPDRFPTQRALAKALGLSGASVTYLLKGDRSPSIETAIAASRLTEFPIDYMAQKPPPGAPPGGKK